MRRRGRRWPSALFRCGAGCWATRGEETNRETRMFEQWVHSQVAMGLGQAMVVCALALAVAWLGHLRNLELGRETVVALLRGLLQMLAIGLVLVWLLKG